VIQVISRSPFYYERVNFVLLLDFCTFVRSSGGWTFAFRVREETLFFSKVWGTQPLHLKTLWDFWQNQKCAPNSRTEERNHNLTPPASLVNYYGKESCSSSPKTIQAREARLRKEAAATAAAKAEAESEKLERLRLMEESAALRRRLKRGG
jgi:hypothetical protein